MEQRRLAVRPKFLPRAKLAGLKPHPVRQPVMSDEFFEQSGEQIDAEPFVTVCERPTRYFGGGGFGREA